MALVYLRMVEVDKIKNNFIINTNNIKSIFRFKGANNSGFWSIPNEWYGF